MFSHLDQLGLALHGLVLATTSSTKKTSSSSTTLLIIVGFALLLYFFVLRPRNQRMRRSQAQTKGADVGDEVMLASGIIGRVTGIEGDRATVEIAPEIEVEVVRRAISTVLEKADAGVPLDVPPDPGSEEYRHDHPDEDGSDDYHDARGPVVAGDYEDEDEDTAEPADHERSATDGTQSGLDSEATTTAPGPGGGLDLGREGHSSP